MKRPLLDLSEKVDRTLVDACAQVTSCAENLKIPHLVVGAFARDLVLHYYYGLTIQRATSDMDFAFWLHSWGDFDLLKNELIANGFTATDKVHRLRTPNEYPLDIVPFGGLADKNTKIQWPPTWGVEMNVLGFQEALDHADKVRLRSSPDVEISVASPVGMVLLKCISWMDREPIMRKKDAADIAYLLDMYERIPTIKAVLYDDPELLDIYDYDLSLVGAHHLGIDAKKIASQGTLNIILSLLENQLEGLPLDILISEMSTSQNTNRKRAFINAFRAGLKAE